jgi:hypothetical protein
MLGCVATGGAPLYQTGLGKVLLRIFKPRFLLGGVWGVRVTLFSEVVLEGAVV